MPPHALGFARHRSRRNRNSGPLRQHLRRHRTQHKPLEAMQRERESEKASSQPQRQRNASEQRRKAPGSRGIARQEPAFGSPSLPPPPLRPKRAQHGTPHA